MSGELQKRFRRLHETLTRHGDARRVVQASTPVSLSRGLLGSSVAGDTSTNPVLAPAEEFAVHAGDPAVFPGESTEGPAVEMSSTPDYAIYDVNGNLLFGVDPVTGLATFGHSTVGARIDIGWWNTASPEVGLWGYDANNDETIKLSPANGVIYCRGTSAGYGELQINQGVCQYFKDDSGLKYAGSVGAAEPLGDNTYWLMLDLGTHGAGLYVDMDIRQPAVYTAKFGKVKVGDITDPAYMIDALMPDDTLTYGIYLANSDGFVGLGNGTSTANTFLPWLQMSAKGAGKSGLVGCTSNDDSDATPIMTFRAQVNSGLVSNRHAFRFSNHTTQLLEVYATGDLLSAGGLVVNGDFGAAGGVGITNSTQGVSTGTGTVKMNGTTSRNSTGWWKINVGTNARYVPYWTTITG